MLAEIEDAILLHLTGALTLATVGYKVATIASYGGEFDEDIGQAVRAMPAVWVAYAGSGKPAPVGTSGERFRTPAMWSVMVGARNVRGERFTRQGVKVGNAIAEVGTYQMLEDVRSALLRQDFDLAIEPLTPGAVRTLYNTRLNNQALSVLSLEMHTAFVIELPRVPVDANDPDWLRLGVQYRLKPGDDITDASDVVELEAAA